MQEKLRPSPTQSATLYKVGTKKTGNDGNIWIVSESSNGVLRWKLHKKPISSKQEKTKSASSKKRPKKVSNVKTKSKSDSKSKPKKVKKFLTLDFYDIPKING
jgi:hypothetical protein